MGANARKTKRRTGITHSLLQEIATHLNPASHPATDKRNTHAIKCEYMFSTANNQLISSSGFINGIRK
jgi:hypothetical protein